MKRILNLACFFLAIVLTSCTGKTENSVVQPVGKQQETIVGGGCDGCELMFRGMPEKLVAVDTSAGWNEPGQKLIVEGTVLKLDGKTKAPGVTVYYWQTDNSGLYSKTAEENTIHGHLRGWMKTDQNGNFRIYTVRPASYPDSNIPAHIHFSIKEPEIANEYYIDDLLFDDDPFLTVRERKKLAERGGNGVGKTETRNGVQYIKREIILGLNIPDYPR